MRKLLVGVITAVVLPLTGCGAASTAPTPTPSAGPRLAVNLPPGWVQYEVAWQALNAGDGHPARCLWTYTTVKRANSLAPTNAQLTGLLPAGHEVYVAIVYGKFPPDPANHPFAARAFYVVLAPQGHYYWALRFLASPPKLAGLGPLHSYVPELPVLSGVWGHTMFAGGPAPGGPAPLPDLDVGIWRGSASGTGGPASPPWRTARSDADGFLSIKLPAGVYTLKLLAKDRGFPEPATVTVISGQPVAAGVYGVGM